MSIFKSKYFWLVIFILFFVIISVFGVVANNKKQRQLEEYTQNIIQLDTLYNEALSNNNIDKALEIAKDYENKGYVEGISLQWWIYADGPIDIAKYRNIQVNSNYKSHKNLDNAKECYNKIEQQISSLEKYAEMWSRLTNNNLSISKYILQPSAMCLRMAELYEKEKDYNNAKYWYEKYEDVALTDNGVGYFLIYYMYRKGYLNTEQQSRKKLDYFQALNYLKKALNAYPKSLDKSYSSIKLTMIYEELGWFYKNGKGTRRDLQKAKEMYGKACDLGSDKGCYNYKKLEERILENNIH